MVILKAGRESVGRATGVLWASLIGTRNGSRYPLHRIVAVVDDAPNPGLALADLGAADTTCPR